MLPTASPESVGVARVRLQQAFGHLQGWLSEGIVTAVACVVVRRGRLVGEFYGGKPNANADAPATSATTLFHIASIGKAMTALATMLLVEAGRLSLDDAVATVLPSFKGEGRDAINVRHLLTHTSGLPQDPGPEITSHFALGADTATQLKFYPHSKLAAPIGSKVEYSNVGYGLLGLIIEAISGQSYADFVREHLFVAADLHDSHLAPPPTLYARIAQVNGTPNPGTPYERFNSDYARTLTSPIGSHIATARDVATFYQMFLAGGRVGHRQIIAPATAHLMATNHTAGLRGGIEGFMTWDDCGWGLGFDLRGNKRPHFSGEFTSPQTFGNTGVAGTFGWADPTRELVVVMLANRMLHSLWNFPRWSRFSTALVAALVD